jgi:hypothetical protein
VPKRETQPTRQSWQGDGKWEPTFRTRASQLEDGICKYDPNLQIYKLGLILVNKTMKIILSFVIYVSSVVCLYYVSQCLESQGNG